MTEDEARQVAMNLTNDELQSIAAALSIRPVYNTDEDWRLLEAACLTLGELAPPRAVTALKAHKFSGDSGNGRTADAVWNDRAALYCLHLVLSRGDANIPSADMAGFLRSQSDA